MSRKEGHKFLSGQLISTSKIQTLFLSFFQCRRQDYLCKELKLHDGLTRGTTARKSHKVLILVIGNISRI
jgi:hypothetical protein